MGTQRRAAGPTAPLLVTAPTCLALAYLGEGLERRPEDPVVVGSPGRSTPRTPRPKKIHPAAKKAQRQGVEGLRARMRRDLSNARWLAEQVDAAAPEWERMAPVPLQTVCVRHRPKGVEGAALDRHNLELVNAVNATGRADVTGAVVKGAQLIRMSVGSAATERADVEALWALMRRTARAG